MQKLAVAGIRLEGFPTPNGSIRVVVHSATGQQEIFVTFAEWCGLSGIETALQAAGRLVTDAQEQRDRAVADVARLDELHRAELIKLDRELAKARTENRELKASREAYTEATRG